MKILFKIIILIFLFNVPCNSQWISQVSGTPRHLLGLDVVDSNIIYCAGELGANVKTTNGGLNWFSIPPPVVDDYADCSFLNANTGLFMGPPGQLIRTTDGGATWSVRSHPLSGGTGVQFVNERWAYACGAFGVIRSTDGGLNWLLSHTFSNGIANLFFTDTLIGTVVGSQGFIATTTDGGVNWIQRKMNLPVQFGDSTLFSVQFINNLTGFSSGNNGIVIKTSNAGINWQYIPLGISIAASVGVYFINSTTGYTVSNGGRIFRTSNGGSNWNQLPSGVSDPLDDIEFINANTGWIAGFNGRILKTTNGGVTFINPISTEVPSNFKLEQNYPNPFNPETRIRFSIPEISRNEKVNISIYNSLGSEVATVVNDNLSPGTYETSWNGEGFPSGVYYYLLTTSSYKETKKMILLK